MRITKALAALVLVFSLTGYCVSGYIPENSRQGSDPVFADLAPGPTPSVSAFTAGFVAWDTTNRIGHRIWGNFRWPDKPGHGVKPCKDEELGDLLDRLDFGRSLGGPGHDPYHYGRHFAATISPYLYASRRFDTFSQTYNNRNRQYNPRFGRFISADPLGFGGGNNLWTYPLNPLRWLDPFGLDYSWAEAQDEGLTYTEWLNDPETTSNDIGNAEGIVPTGDEGLLIVIPGLWNALSRHCLKTAGKKAVEEVASEVSKRNLKHIAKHLKDFQNLDPKMAIDDLLKLGKEISSDLKNLVGTPGGRKAFEKTVQIGGKDVPVKVILNPNGGLRSVYIKTR